MQDTLQDHHTSISTGGRPLCNLRFTDDIELMRGSINELKISRTVSLPESAYGMEVSTEMPKGMLNSTNEISVNITMNGESLKK